jgi:CheY-like chemotaxis protein
MGPFSPFSYIDPDYICPGILAGLASADGLASPDEQRDPKRTAKGRLRVLVVDDHFRIADTTAEVLQQAGFEVKAVYGGQAALKVAAGFAPDCLLSDVMMPDMNGVELALAFRELRPEARVVLMSGQMGISEVLEDAERRGLEFELLPKPIHPVKLIEYLRKQPGS